MTPWDITASIQIKKYNFDETSYSGFMVNKIFSMSEKTIKVANLVNKMPSITKQMQYDLYYSMVNNGGGYIKWIKKDKENKDEIEQINIIKKKFNINELRAKEYLQILRSKKTI